MTVFCPNCGKPNTDTATTCVSCGTELKPAGPRGGKFKGTMMMSGVNAPPPPRPGGAPPPGGGAPPPAGGAPPPAGSGPVQPGSPGAKQNMAFQKTMLGPMSPPGPGGAPKPPSAPPPPPPSSGGGGFGGAPPSGGGAPPSSGGSSGGFGAPPPSSGGGFGAPPPSSGGSPGGFGGAPPPSSGGSSGGFGAPPPSSGGSSGGFGGAPPPSSGGSSGGFGAPPAGSGSSDASQPGFGAPPSGGGGGWGQPPQGGGGGAPPSGGGGGWGQPPQGGGAPPGGGGFGGAPVGGPPPSGGGFGGPPQGGPPGTGPTAAPKKSKKGLIFAGIGCLLLLLIGCIVGTWLMCSAAEEASDQLGGQMGAELNRISLTFTLGGIQMSCTSDPSGAGAATYFHPQVAAQYQAQACQVTNTTVEAFGDANRSRAEMLPGTDDESRASALGVDPSQCTRFTSGSAKVIACNLGDVEGFKIIHLENPGSVQ